MRAHAVVIGIDHYTKNPQWDLKGATRDAVNFAKWVTEYGGVAPGDLTLLLSPPAGTKRPKELKSGNADWQTIVDTLDDYEERRKAKGAKRFWLYYAGHGMAAPGEGPSAGPLIVPADTPSVEFYLKHWRISMELFRESMQDVEPKEQFFFIDACRDVLDVKEKKTLTQRIYWDPSNINDGKLATQVVFLATTVGKKAKELRGQGIFSRVLLAALKGLGPTLDEPSDSKAGRLSLYFNNLNEWVREAMKRALAEVQDVDDDAREGSVPYATIGRSIGNVEIAQFDVKKLPTAKITAVVEPVAARKSARLDFVEWSKAVADNVPLADPPPIDPLGTAKPVFVLRGGKHKVRVQAPGYTTITEPLYVFEDKSVLLTLKKQPGAKKAAAADAALESLAVPKRSRTKHGSIGATSVDRLTRLTVVDGGGKVKARGVGQLDVDLKPGPYVLRGELSGVPVKEETVVVEAGVRSPVSVDIGRGNYDDPSENFGPIANAKFSSMLAFAAWAARWPPTYGFHRLRAMGVDPLPALAKQGSAVQVLIGDAMEDRAFLAACKVALQKDERTPLEALPLTPLSATHALQGAEITKWTAVRARVEMPGFVPTTFALSLLPRLITVLIVTREKNGNVEIQQHFNPIDPTTAVAERFDSPKLDDVRVVDIGSRALENRESLDDHDYERLLDAKGTNPMLGLIAGYRTLNTKRAKDFRGLPLENMLHAFPGLPDVHVLAGLHDPKQRDMHFRRAMEAGTPVFAEGFWALFDWITKESGKRNLAPPVLRQQLTAGMVWTSFLDAPAGEKDTVRIVTTSGRTSLATISDDRSVMAAARAVGRIGPDDGAWMSTAFLIAPRVAVVPVHVATAFASRDADGRWTLTKPPVIRFDLDDPKSARRVAEVLRTVRPPSKAKIDPGSIDMNLLEDCWPVLMLLADDAPAPPLAIAGQASKDRDRVSVIGFPMNTATPATFEFAHHFAAASGEKHVMPGLVQREAGKTWTFDHNCFTAPGTSGGPIVNHAGQVVGMHVVGRPSGDGYKTGVGIAMTRFKPEALA